MRRLCLALLLSQVLAIQALVVAWSGAQAAVPVEGTLTLICKGAQSGGNAGDQVPNAPLGPHHDCLSACTGGLSALEPQPIVSVLVGRKPSRSVDVPRDSGLLVALTTQVFSARGPPALS